MHEISGQVPLTFRALDGLAFLGQRGRLDEKPTGRIYLVDELGPLMEWTQLSAAELLPDAHCTRWLKLGGLSALYTAARSPQASWISPGPGCLGVFKTSSDIGGTDPRWNAFRLAAHKAALSAGFQSRTVSQLIGALSEIHDNIFEHSLASYTGLTAFRASPHLFEFTVSDRGIGVLASLRMNLAYAELADHGVALELALTDGISRYGSDTQRGGGFRQLFKGVASLNATLRFRSGDHALTMEGQNPTLLTAKSAVKPSIPGFLASISCYGRAP